VQEVGHRPSAQRGAHTRHVFLPRRCVVRRHLVESLVPGSGAEQCGEIFAGDELLTVDGVDVNGRQVADLAPIFMGPSGSTAILTLMRRLEPTNSSLEAGHLVDLSDEVLALSLSRDIAHSLFLEKEIILFLSLAPVPGSWVACYRRDTRHLRAGW